MTDIFKYFYDRQVEFLSGRIETAGSTWKYITDKDNIPADKLEDVKNGGHYTHYDKDGNRFFVRVDGDGKTMILVPGSGVMGCPNPSFKGTYPPMAKDKERFFVPLQICRKCEFYRTAKLSKRRYATCSLDAKDNPKREAAKSLLGAISESVKATNEVFSR